MMTGLEREVTLAEVLEAREARVRRQDALREEYGAAVVSFTMNIAGPVKNSALIRRAFRAGVRQLECGLRAWNLEILHGEENLAAAGCEALYAVSGPAGRVKRVCQSIEDGSRLGRLFDMDVISAAGEKLNRSGEERRCIVCGAAGRGCASRRVHSVPELQDATKSIIIEYFFRSDRELVSRLVTQALLDEVCVTPKPGLVDRANSGSHRDMDVFTFTASAAALWPYWGKCVEIGRETAGETAEAAFRALRREGQAAERAMFDAAGGVNTHKGAIFTLGLLCGAVGRLWKADAPCRDVERILTVCAELARCSFEKDFAEIRAEKIPRTAGERIYREQGITGIRGEAARGLPSVREVALPVLRRALDAGKSRNDAGAAALLHLIAQVDDTNLIARGGMEAARAARTACAGLLEKNPLPDMEEIAELDRAFTRRNLSPGGCADLLAAAFFLLSWEAAE